MQNGCRQFSDLRFSTNPCSQSDKMPLSLQLSVGQVLSVYVAKVAAETVGKGNQQVKRIQVSVEPHHLNTTMEDFSQHDVLRGRVKSVEDHGVLVDLGNGRQGFCKFVNVEGEYHTEIESTMPSQGRLLNVGRIHDFILEDKAKSTSETRIVSLCLPKSLAKRLNPTTYHPTLQDLNPGGLVNCKVEAVARNGLLVSFGIFRGAIHVNHFGANWIPVNRQGSDSEWKAIFAEVRNVAARIIAVDARTKLIRLSLQPHVLNLAQPPELPPVGTIIENATVIRLDPGIGALLSLPLIQEPIKIPSPALRKNESYCEAVQRPAAYVHISKATSERMSEADFTKEYAPSTQHKLRILSNTHWLEGMATGATAPDVVDAHVLQHSDLIPGEIYRSVPICGQLEGGSIMVDFGMNVRGIIPALHLFDQSNMTSDYRTKLRKEKFVVGNKIDVRVLSIDTKTKRCVVTAKKSLLKATDAISNFSEVQPGQVITGYVSKLDDKSLYVTFYNKVYGRVTARSLAAELGVENHRLDYHVGDVVKCRVISCRRRVGKNLNTYVDDEMEALETDDGNRGYWDLNLSCDIQESASAEDEAAMDKAKERSRRVFLRSGEVLPAKSMKVIELIPSIDKKRGIGFIPGHAIVRIKSKFIARDGDADALPYVECKVPYDQILDSYDAKDSESKETMDEFAKKHFTIGKKIDKQGLVLSDPKKSTDEYASGIGKLPIVSLRPELIKTAEANAEKESEKCKLLIPNAETSLYMGAFVQGFVHQSDPRHGAFVRFLDDVTGLVPNIKKGMNLQKWDTVTCKIVALDVTCVPPKILLRRASPGLIEETSIEHAIKPGDKVDAVEVLDVNFSRANLRILDSKLASHTKIRARVHVTMAESVPISNSRRHKDTDLIQDKETIRRGHPFYKWTKGTLLKNLVCVSSDVRHGVTFLELSNWHSERAEIPLFVKKSSELQPGTKVSGIIVGVAKSRRGIWVQPSPGVNCFVPALELCQDVDILNELHAYYPVGARLDCRVMNKGAWMKKQNWSVRVPKLKTDDESKHKNAEVPFLSVLLSQGDSVTIDKPTKGQLIVGRINRAMRLYRAPSLMLDLRGGYHGRCCITELEEVDEWENMPLGRQQAHEDVEDNKTALSIEDEKLPEEDDDEKDSEDEEDDDEKMR